MCTGGWWPRIEDSGGGSSTGRQRRVATLTPEIRETRKRESQVKMFEILSEMGFPKHLAALLEALHNDQSAVIRLGH